MDTRDLTMTERDARIFELWKQKLTYKAIGKEVHLTDARCCQIVKGLLKRAPPQHA